jgi:hypothetical protein
MRLFALVACAAAVLGVITATLWYLLTFDPAPALLFGGLQAWGLLAAASTPKRRRKQPAHRVTTVR